MEELRKIIVVDQTYKSSNLSLKKNLSVLTLNKGTKQSNSTAITMIMSIAAFFSRLNRTDAFGPDKASPNCLLCRRMAMKIPKWFTIGRMTKITPKRWLKTNWALSGKMNRSRIVIVNQIVPVMAAACTAPDK